ncbi:YcbK family protein [Glaesserella parasuis]|uniref:YcbK family protein n=1 Tax=Glaesserella parasuis TaxID=738 RepID=UPI002436B61C|nr:YcbK family protein [Glaesserella parasuis]MDG6448768.1 YcbK family protein [Glaesserella parasuis]MDG6475800.1 YcbK family protein [Glaesserella parasuis]
MEQTNLQRRRWLALGGIVLGATLLPNIANALVSTPKPLTLRLKRLNTGETLSANYSSNGFATKDLGRLNHIMRDVHINRVKHIDPRLFVKLTQIQARLGVRNSEILIVSGYRSAQTNARLRRRSRGVASNSYHILGKAIDFRIEGVPLARIKAAAESLNNGGVGYYPRSNFVHVDTGPVRTWRGS